MPLRPQTISPKPYTLYPVPWVLHLITLTYLEEDVYDNLGAASVAGRYAIEGAAGVKQAQEQVAYWTSELAKR